MKKQIQVQFKQNSEYAGKSYSYHTDLDFNVLDRAVVFTDDYYVVLVVGLKPSKLATQWVVGRIDVQMEECIRMMRT